MTLTEAPPPALRSVSKPHTVGYVSTYQLSSLCQAWDYPLSCLCLRGRSANKASRLISTNDISFLFQICLFSFTTNDISFLFVLLVLNLSFSFATNDISFLFVLLVCTLSFSFGSRLPATVNPARLPTLSDDSHHWRLPHHMIAVPTSSCFNKSWYEDHFHAYTRFQNWQHIAESQQIVVRRPLSCLQYYAVFKSYTKDLNPPIFKKLFWHDYQHFQMMAGPCLI